jgi:predicted phage baseplate assembly protein
VLEGARLEVQELRGARANVEWRILAREIAPGNSHLIAELEELLGREGSETDLEVDDIRLRRDRKKHVTDVWVRWQEQAHLFSSGPEDRHFTIDRASGRVQFGDGTLGKVLPVGATVLARQYQAGGGKTGNVAVGAISQLLGGVAGVEGASNPRAAEGGADGETLERFQERGPATVRHRGRAISPLDYETLAREASPAVAVARAVPTRNATGQTLPGWVTVILIPESQAARPWPSFGLREQVRRFIEQYAPCGIAAAHRVHITGADYLPVDVAATIAPLSGETDIGAVEDAAREALEEFLHPLRGGPERRGWTPGRHVFLSDVAAALERIAGVDYVEELTLMLEGNPQGASVRVAEDRVVVAGEIRLKFKASED